MPYRMRKVEQVVAEITADNQPYAVFVDNNLGSRPGYLRELKYRPTGAVWKPLIEHSRRRHRFGTGTGHGACR
jgi:hypothetical protein